MWEACRQIHVHVKETERKIKMPTYQITFSIIGSGSLEIEAETVKEAVELFENTNVTDIFDDVDFGSMEIEQVTEDGEEVELSKDD